MRTRLPRQFNATLITVLMFIAPYKNKKMRLVTAQKGERDINKRKLTPGRAQDSSFNSPGFSLGCSLFHKTDIPVVVLLMGTEQLKNVSNPGRRFRTSAESNVICPLFKECRSRAVSTTYSQKLTKLVKNIPLVGLR